MSVLEEAGLRVVLSTRSDTEGLYEEEFADLLHFSTLEEAEMCLIRLDELLAQISRRGRTRRGRTRPRNGAPGAPPRGNDRAQSQSGPNEARRESTKSAHWFAIWLDTPDAFFDWLEVRKQSPEFQSELPRSAAAEDEA